MRKAQIPKIPTFEQPSLTLRFKRPHIRNLFQDNSSGELRRLLMCLWQGAKKFGIF